jgi:hypothetical protein
VEIVSGLGKWSFRLFIESPHRSPERPLQTPASIGLRYLRDDETTRKLLANQSPPNFTSLIRTTWKTTRQASHRVYDITPIALGDFAVSRQIQYPRYGQEGWTTNHHPPSLNRSRFRERKAETGPTVQAGRITLNHHPRHASRTLTAGTQCRDERSQCYGRPVQAASCKFEYHVRDSLLRYSVSPFTPAQIFSGGLERHPSSLSRPRFPLQPYPNFCCLNYNGVSPTPEQHRWVLR